MMPRSLSARVAVAVLSLLLLIGTATVVQGAVQGQFSSTYDGYDDQQTETSGHEILIEGTLSVSGDPAINPVIRIQSGQDTVLEQGSVQASVPATQGIEFTKRYTENGVELVLSGDRSEIPPGTEIQIQYVVYPKGVEKSTYRSGNVVMAFERAGGQRTRESFTVETQMQDSPWQRISDLESQLSVNKPLDDFIDIAGYAMGIIGIIALIAALSIYRSDDDNGDGPAKPDEDDPTPDVGPPGSD